ncbi:MAG: hypothetical protein U0264_05460 [Candidatus Kapaibacterium sp.]
MAHNRTKKFELYRYQIIPQKTGFQYSILEDIKNEEDLLKNKNTIFAEIVKGTKTYKNGNDSLINRIEHQVDDLFIIHFGQPRKRKITTNDFRPSYVDDYPDAILAFNNAPEVQMIAIQSNSEAFRQTRTLANIFQNTVNKVLIKHNLGIVIEPIFDPKDFWDLVRKYEKKITQVRFNIVRPNMPNISKELTFDLKAFSQDVGSTRSSFEFTSGDDSHLNLSPSNETINGLVNYSAAGGGNITLKAKGMRRFMKTNDKISEAIVDEYELHGPPDEVVKVFKTMMSL